MNAYTTSNYQKYTTEEVGCSGKRCWPGYGGIAQISRYIISLTFFVLRSFAFYIFDVTNLCSYLQSQLSTNGCYTVAKQMGSIIGNPFPETANLSTPVCTTYIVNIVFSLKSLLSPFEKKKGQDVT